VSPHQFLTGLKQREPASAYLFAGPEPFRRDWCRSALLDRALGAGEERESGVTRYDLEETSLAAVIEDARSLSLFASRRVILVANAEAALPRGRASGEEDDNGVGARLGSYLESPTEGVVIVFEAARYDFQGEDKKKLARVQEFYSAVPVTVEFPQMSAEEARKFAENQARRAGLDLSASELDLLVEALGSKAQRIDQEIEKLRVYAAGGKRIGAAEIAALVPEARESTIFVLVGALGRNDRVGALEVLDTLIRQGEYLPLALSFLGTQFRLALAAKEAGLRSASQVQAHFSRQGMPMWGSRAEQVFQTVTSFSSKKLGAAVEAIYGADRALRDARPDDRLVMEEFILRLTA
jgi:DNA polymerase-3 subunit delta